MIIKIRRDIKKKKKEKKERKKNKRKIKQQQKRNYNFSVRYMTFAVPRTLNSSLTVLIYCKTKQAKGRIQNSLMRNTFTLT